MTYFTEDDSKRITDKYKSAIRECFSMTNINAEGLNKLIDALSGNTRKGLKIMSAELDCLDGQLGVEMSKPENKEMLVNILEEFASFPSINFENAVNVIASEISELEAENVEYSEDSVIASEISALEAENSGPIKSLRAAVESRLSELYEKTRIAKGIANEMSRFPFLFTRNQQGKILESSKEELTSIKPAVEFIKSLSPEAISRGELDYNRIRDLNKYYNAFTPSFLTLLEREYLQLPEGYRCIPVLNSNFPDSKRFDFKGVLAVVSEQSFNAINSIEPKMFQIPAEGTDIKNFLTHLLLMAPLGAEPTLLQFCSLLKEDYGAFRMLKDRTIFLNAAQILADEQLKNIDEETIISSMTKPTQMIAASIKRTAEEAHLKISETGIKSAANELASTGFLVKYSYMRHQQGYADINNIPRAMSPGITIIDLLGRYNALVPMIQLYTNQLWSDIDRIFREGLRKMPDGTRFFSENKNFFDSFKSEKELAVNQTFEIIKKMHERMQDKELKKFIETTIDGAKSASESMRKGNTNHGVMHYLSLRNSGVLIEGINRMQRGDPLLGYAMNNCLGISQLIRYHSNPNAKIRCFWLSGYRVGMSYEVDIVNDAKQIYEAGAKPESTIPLIDSIELSDSFYTLAEKCFTLKEGEQIPKNYFVSLFISGYLISKVQHSKKGILILPESNNYHVREAMEEFIHSFGGKKIFDYQGTKVQTDTRFEAIPYFIEKAEVMKQVSTGFVDMKNGTLQEGKIMRISEEYAHQCITETNPLLTEEAREALNEQIRNAMNA